MLMPKRSYSAAGSYRYGFNGKENDNDVKGLGNQFDYGFRIYDSRVGRFLSVDPLFKGFPWYTPYQYAGNRPTKSIDLDGLEEYNKEIEGGDILINIFNKAVDGASNLLLVLAVPQTEGLLIRKALLKQGFNIPDDENLDVKFSQLFDIKKENRQFVVVPERKVLEKLFDLGIASIDVAAVFPSKGSFFFAAARTNSISAAAIGDILRSLRIYSRTRQITEEFLDIGRGSGVKIGEFEAESAAILEEAHGVKLRGLKEGETGDYAFEKGSINGIDVGGKTIDQVGIPKSAVGKFRISDLNKQITRHLNEKQGVDYVLIDGRNLTEAERKSVSEYINTNHAKDAKRIMTIGF